jgi:hypothetical protein
VSESRPNEPAEERVPASLAETLVAAAAGLESIERRPGTGGAVEYLRAGRVLAILEAGGTAASFLLSPAVADAALRTPDTAPSTRGRGWITLRPTILDGHAVDRATAWLESAWRHAGG